MYDMTAVIAPKSDQTNADDFLTGPRTITISRVDIRAGTEQPVSIWFEGDAGKPWKPCKSMCRLLVAAWGPDTKCYIGRSATLYRDPDVKWGGMAVGGIRVSHLSHIERDFSIALTATKGKRAICLVKALHDTPAPAQPTPEEATAAKRARSEEWARKRIADIEQAGNRAALDALCGKIAEGRKKLHEEYLDLFDMIQIAENVRRTIFDEADLKP